MSNSDEKIIFPKRYTKIKLDDILFIAIRKNLLLLKDLHEPNIHYTMIKDGSLIDIHQTIEDPHKHISLAKMHFDEQVFMDSINQEIKANWRSLAKKVSINDPEWKNVKMEILPIQAFSYLKRGEKLRISLEEFGKSLKQITLRELAVYSSVTGIVSKFGKEYLVLKSGGTDCFLFDINKLKRICDKSFNLSIR